MTALSRSLAILLLVQACATPDDPIFVNPGFETPELPDGCAFEENAPRHTVLSLEAGELTNDDGYVTSLRVELNTHIGDLVLDLHQNIELLAPAYRDQEWRDGEVVTVGRPGLGDICQYQGNVELADGTPLPRSTAAISTCTGYALGLISVNGVVYELAHDESGYGLLGRDLPTLQDEYSDSLALSTSEFQFVELYMVSDPLRQNRFTNGTELRADSMSLANAVNWIFKNADGEFNSDFRVVLTGHLTFQRRTPWRADRIGSEVDSGDLLTKFRTWRNAAPGLAFHDVAMLLTGDNPDGQVVGLAWVETACAGDFDVSFTATLGTTAYNGVVAAHELGHNLGSEHDEDGVGCGTGGVMSAFVALGNDTWSTCSTNAIDNHLAARTCFDDPAPELVSLRGAHGDYVVAELNGAANANRAIPFAWETFELIRHGGGKVSLRSYHNRYLVAELNGEANANRTQIGNWEKWTLQGNWDGTVAFRSFHNTYLVAEPTGDLHADRTVRGAWESFQMRDAAWWINR